VVVVGGAVVAAAGVLGVVLVAHMRECFTVGSGSLLIGLELALGLRLGIVDSRVNVVGSLE
jgi:hypothetical protein